MPETPPAPRRARKAAGGRPDKASAARLGTAILAAAEREFFANGFSGARMEAIAEASGTSRQTLYARYGSKEALFIAVLEEIYRRMDEAEAALALDESRPLEALSELIRFVTRYYRAHPEFVTLLNTENLLKGRHVARSRRAKDYSLHAIGVTDRLLRAGVAQQCVRPGIDARQLYLLIAAAGYFHAANRYTLAAFLGERIDTPAAVSAWEDFVIDSVIRMVQAR